MKKTIIPLAVGTLLMNSANEPIDINAETMINQNNEIKIEQQQKKGENSEIANIPDLNLKAGLNKAIDPTRDPKSDITIVEMNNLKGVGGRLDLSNLEITDLTGIEHAINIKILEVSNNQITDLTPIANLTNLTTLAVNSNPVTNLDALENFTSMLSLYAANCNITDISGIRNLTEIGYIVLNNNQITDISPIGEIEDMAIVLLSNNKISDVSAFENKLISTLDLRSNQITDISPLANVAEYSPEEGEAAYKGINGLYLGNNQITDLTPLSSWNAIGAIDISNNQITDLTPLSNNKNLEVLEASNQEIQWNGGVIGSEAELPNSVIDLDGTNMPLNIPFEKGEISGTTNWDNDNPDFHFSGTYNYQYINKGAKPEIKGTKDVILTWNSSASSYNFLAGVTAIDKEDGDITGNLTFDDSQIVYDTSGNYQGMYTVTDSDGNTTTEEINVYVDDLPDLKTKSFRTSINQKPNYRDSLSAIDKEDGDITDKVIIDDSQVDLTKEGRYTLVYTIEDSAGNTVLHNELVDVVINEPVIHGIKDQSVEEGGSLDLMDGVFALDVEDGILTDKIIVDDTKVDYSTPGDYKVIYTVTDSDGNTTIEEITVTVTAKKTDNHPVINGTKNQTVEEGETLDLMNGVTAEDAEDGILTDKIIVDDTKVDYSTPGDYKVTYTVTDSDGNTVVEEITVTVLSTIIPWTEINPAEKVIPWTEIDPAEKVVPWTEINPAEKVVSWTEINPAEKMLPWSDIEQPITTNDDSQENKDNENTIKKTSNTSIITISALISSFVALTVAFVVRKNIKK